MTDLFTGAPQTQGEHVDNPLETLVGEGKKFKTVEELAKGKLESDHFIKRLQDELSGLRDELGKRAQLGDLVDKLAGLQKTPDIPKDDNQDPPDPSKVNPLDPTKLEETVAKLLEQREQKTTRERNITKAKEVLAEKLGPNYAEKLQSKAAELGLTPQYLNEVAANSPQALFRLVGVEEATHRADIFTPPDSQRQASFTPNANVRNKAYYDKMKQTDPVNYWKPQTQNQMHKDALELKERFF